MNATPLHATVVLDDDAIEAERRALLAELVAERFAPLRATTDRAPYPKETNASLHLRKAARLAREVADDARERCAHQYQGRAS
jgi:hypothetical protein